MFSWISKLNWRDASMTGQVLAMISFIFGGAGGIVNASYAFSPVVHNTAWIPGHFHITVGTATTLSFMAIAFWLIPHLTGKRLASASAALGSVWLWFIGMMVMGLGMHWQGLAGVPRRSHISVTVQQAVFDNMNLALPKMLTGLGGVILLIAGLTFFYVLFATLLSKRVEDPENTPIPYADYISYAGTELKGATSLVKYTEPLLVIAAVALVITLIVYLPAILPMIANYQAVPGQRLW